MNDRAVGQVLQDAGFPAWNEDGGEGWEVGHRGRDVYVYWNGARDNLMELLQAENEALAAYAAVLRGAGFPVQQRLALNKDGFRWGRWLMVGEEPVPVADRVVFGALVYVAPVYERGSILFPVVTVPGGRWEVNT